jgi:hypothetical protein
MLAPMLPPRLPPFARVRVRAALAALVCMTAAAGAPSASAQGAAPRAAAPKAASTAPKPLPPPTVLPVAPPAPIDSADDAQRYFQQGQDALNRLAYADAESALTKAWALSKSFDVAAALGEAKLEVGKYREAADYLSFGLRSALPSTKASTRDRLKKNLDKAKSKLATVKLSASDPDAKLIIDSVLVDPTFFGPEVFVDPGKRSFEATRDGFTPAKEVVDMVAGQIYVVALKLEPVVTAPTVAPPPPPAETWPAAVLGGTGGLAIVAGAVLVLVAESKKTEAYDMARNTLTAEGNPTCTTKGPGPTDACDKVRGLAQNADLFGNVGIGAFIGGGVLMTAAAVYVLWPRAEALGKPGAPGAPAKTGRVVPVIGPTGGGLVWRGAF